MVILGLLGCWFDQGYGCAWSFASDCAVEGWEIADPAAMPSAAWEVQGGQVPDVRFRVFARNPSTAHDCLAALYRGSDAPSPADFAPLDPESGPPETLGGARLVGAVNVARDWGIEDTGYWDDDTGATWGPWGSGYYEGNLGAGKDGAILVGGVNAERQYFTLVTCAEVSLHGQAGFVADYGGAAGGLISDTVSWLRWQRLW